jgi:uncharacterized protein
MARYGKMIIAVFTISLIATVGLSWAQNIKQRMRERIPVITDLKARGIVGEDNRGYLAFVKGHSEKKEVVAAENQDRKLVYQAIGKKQGTTADLVGQRRALQIAKMATSGEWLQKTDGTWYQKK